MSNKLSENKMDHMNWEENYELQIDNVAPEDGGGFRIYFPTLGYAVYGVGDTLDEAQQSLRSSIALFNKFMEETSEYCLPAQTPDDYKIAEQRRTAANTNFAYAA